MEKSSKRIAYFLAVFLLAIATSAQAEQVKVLHVLDGDTIKVESADTDFRVGLIGIDAPEIGRPGRPGQPYSQAAKTYLESLISGKLVDIKRYGTDRYGRALCEVFVDGMSVNLALVRAGLAEVYRGKMEKSFDSMPYHAAEKQARAMQKGVWSLGNIYVSPKVWREGKPLARE